MNIAGYLRTSLIEWPGKISSVIFTPGCNFRCPFCHNRDLVDPEKKEKLENYDEKSVLKDLKSRKKWIDGLCITGGEPTIQPGLPDFLKKVKKINLETMLETNGSSPEVLKKLIKEKLVDFIAMDYKTRFSDYENLVKFKTQSAKIRMTNKNPKLEFNLIENLKKSISLIMNSKLLFEFRTTIVPTIHDKGILAQMAEDLLSVCLNDKQARLAVGRDVNWVLQSFRPENCLNQEFDKIKPFTDEQIGELLKVIRKTAPEIKISQK